MNAVEIEEAISALAEQTFDAQEFPFAFLLAFGNKETTLKRLRKGESNKSDIGGVLQTNKGSCRDNRIFDQIPQNPLILMKRTLSFRHNSSIGLSCV